MINFLKKFVSNCLKIFHAFSVSAFSLIFLHFNTNIPISHHIGLPAATVAALSGSILWAGLIGICCALLGELLSRLFLVHGDTHIDPPALPFLLPPRLFTF